MPSQDTRRGLLRKGGGLAATAAVGGTSGCLTLATQLRSDSIKVGSKRFTEQEILGYLAYEALSANTDLTVGDQVGLGGTTTNFRAVDSGEIQLYWEYTGTAWQTLPPKHDEVITDPAKLYERVKQEFEKRHELTFLRRAPLNNTYVLMANPEWANETGVKSLSGLATHLKETDETVTIALNAEFQSRSDGWPGLIEHYGFDDHTQKIQVKNIGSGLLYQVVGGGEADIGVGFNTDPRIIQFDLQVLKDDKKFFPVYNAAPMVRMPTLEANPSIREPLNAISKGLTTDQMRKLNKRVALDKVNPQTVAKEYLQRAGVL
ncbi:osmoprotectant transport system substrate-binding protein [Halogranum amylolyticum]|uniref:Osmoprotectant transport system substrate-binding protein n=1 Tax=Halogranum amylolyticum TaxID=660520 RepID=A0A1H8MV64_9EURY|nr:glycine betaine ABC transporter substrate-binding protein [Halogranum amylolyticum]SEO21093.1 osmoprotectant transport system substrate-binding protein [Halogranum amylolyticum]